MRIVWSNIVNAFQGKFQDKYQMESRKAYLENVEIHDRLIDGCKVKWCPILLLDSLIFHYMNNIAKRDKSARRIFDQVK